MSLNATREAVLLVLMGGGGADKAGADENAGADDEPCHLLGEVVLGGAIQVVPRAMRVLERVGAAEHGGCTRNHRARLGAERREGRRGSKTEGVHLDRGLQLLEQGL